MRADEAGQQDHRHAGERQTKGGIDDPVRALPEQARRQQGHVDGPGEQQEHGDGDVGQTQGDEEEQQRRGAERAHDEQADRPHAGRAARRASRGRAKTTATTDAAIAMRATMRALSGIVVMRTSTPIEPQTRKLAVARP